jgi:hypothetical protein
MLADKKEPHLCLKESSSFEHKKLIGYLSSSAAGLFSADTWVD